MALNSGLPLTNPMGGYYFVFQAGVPVYRKYDENGTLVFERHVEGPELDPVIAQLPTTWPRRADTTGRELPVVPPTVRTAAVDPDGRLWVALTVPYVYVYDPNGDKIHTVRTARGREPQPDQSLVSNSYTPTRNARVLRVCGPVVAACPITGLEARHEIRSQPAQTNGHGRHQHEHARRPRALTPGMR